MDPWMVPTQAPPDMKVKQDFGPFSLGTLENETKAATHQSFSTQDRLLGATEWGLPASGGKY